MHRTTIYLPDELYEGLMALSERTGSTMANYLCLAAEELLAPHFPEVRAADFRQRAWSKPLVELQSRAYKRKWRVDGRMNRPDRKLWRSRMT